jgi:hypothetical protein
VKLKPVLLPKDFDEARNAYNEFTTMINDFKRHRYDMWFNDVRGKEADNGLQGNYRFSWLPYVLLSLSLTEYMNSFKNITYI